MPKMYPIQPDFSGGELSPRMYGRTDSERYRRGLKTSLNYNISPQGSLFKRPGFELIGKSEVLNEQDSRIRIHEFPVGQNPDLMVEITPDNINLWGSEGKVVDTGAINENIIPNGSFTLGADGLQGWEWRYNRNSTRPDLDISSGGSTVSSSWEWPNPIRGYSVDSSASDVTFATDTPAVAENILYLLGAYRIFVGIGFLLGRFAFDPRYHLPEITRKVPIRANLLNKDMTLRLRMADQVLAPGINRKSKNDVIFATLDNRQQATSVAFDGPEEFLDYGQVTNPTGKIVPEGEFPTESAGVVTISTGPYGGGTVIAQHNVSGTGTKTFTVNPGSNEEIWITMRPKISDGNPNSGDQYWSYPNGTRPSFSDFDPIYFMNVYDVALSPINISGDQPYLSFANPFPAEAIKDLRILTDSSTNSLYLFHQSTQPHALTADGDAQLFNFSPLTLTGIAGIGTDGQWPRGGEIHQSRMWLYSTPNFGSRIWASKIGNYSEYAVTGSAEDGIDRSLATKGIIYWMKSAQGLFLIGTDDGCFTVRSQGAFLSGSDMGVSKFTNSGTANKDAILISNRLVHVGKNDKSVIVIQYDTNSESAMSYDISKYSDHLFRQGINYLIPLEEPFNQIIAVLGDHSWAQCTFDPDDAEFPILAWTRSSTADGGLVSACSVDHGRGGELFALFNRSAGFFVERMNNYTYSHRNMDMWAKSAIEKIEDNVYRLVDTAGYSSSSFVLVHLNYILTYDQFDIEADGTLIIHTNDENINENELVFIGIPYLSRVITLPKETSSLDNSLSNASRRHNKIYVNVISSYAPEVNGQKLADRSATTPFGTAEPFADGVQSYVNLGWDATGEITIIQELPFRSEILSISTDTSVERN